MPTTKTEPMFANWTVTETRGMWVGGMEVARKMLPYQQQLDSGAAPYVKRYIKIMPTKFPWEMAVDAFVDFMDRMREQRIPRGVTTPEELMEACVSAARRQR